MKALSFFTFIINAVLITSLVNAIKINPDKIEWLDIDNWNATNSKLQKRAYEGQIKPLDFYRGVDISSIISLEKSGIQFYNTNGQPDDIFKILYEAGVNCIRVRIWNSPKNASGKYYGGGNNDLEVAREIGSRAAKYGLPLLVDFHYSDFWADPAKQTVPKEWRNFNVDKKAEEIYKFTKGCLEWLLENGSIIAMVQVGNETNCFMCGENQMGNVMKMMSSGAKAVRDVNPKIGIVLHFTNPDKANNMLWYASELGNARVDYDVYATSYYPYWHGTTDNLKNVLGQIANKYGKKVLIAEYSYPYTNSAKTADGSWYGIVSQSSSGVNFKFPISIDGQIQCIQDIYKTIKSIPNGIGAFYWEPAWIAPKARNDAERRTIWETYGSSWASTPGSEFDKSVDRNVAGGTSWDNQAVFDPNGKPLKSLAALGDGVTPPKITENTNTNNANNNTNPNNTNNNTNPNNTNNNTNTKTTTTTTVTTKVVSLFS